jgi:hypothetical protein
MDEKTKAVSPARVVAKMRKPCRLDAGPLAQSVLALTRWYGECFTIPIANERGDVIDNLLTAGISIYSREDLERFRHGRTELVTFGWESNEYNRSIWIGALAEAVRKNLIDVQDIETVMQMFQVTASNAKEKRDAEAVGVGMKEIIRATRYTKVAEGLFATPVKRDLAKAQWG